MSHSNSLRAVSIALLGNFIVAVVKFIVSFITASAAMMAEAIHSTSDCFNQIFLLIGNKRTKKSATEQHSFGYGKEEYFWGFMVAILLFFVGGGFSTYEGIHRLFTPEPIKNVMWSFIVLSISIILEGNSFRVAYLQFKQKYKTTLYKAIVAMNDTNLLVILLEDFAALLGLIIVLSTTILSITVSPIFDAIGSIIVGIILMVIAYILSNELRKLIVGESAPRKVRTDIKNIIHKYLIVNHINRIQTMFIGKEQFILLISIDVDDEALGYTIEDTIEQIKLDITAAYPEASNIYIEVKDSVRNNKI
jgi:cation diffusion facilitator family transporter